MRRKQKEARQRREEEQKENKKKADEIQDIWNGSRILHIGEDLIYVSKWDAH